MTAPQNFLNVMRWAQEALDSGLKLPNLGALDNAHDRFHRAAGMPNINDTHRAQALLGRLEATQAILNVGGRDPRIFRERRTKEAEELRKFLDRLPDKGDPGNRHIRDVANRLDAQFITT